MQIHTRIARRAIATLGRRARPNGQFVDWDMAYAVKAAAKAEGLDAVDSLMQWINPRAHSASAMASFLVARYVQAFGPLGNLIDAGAHMGSRNPIIALGKPQ